MADSFLQRLPALSEGQLPWFAGIILFVILAATMLLQLGTRLIAGFYPAFSQALAALLCSQLASWVVCDLYKWTFGINADNPDFGRTLGVYCTATFVQIVVYSLILREPERNSITMVQATMLCAPQIFLLICFVSGVSGFQPKLPTVAERQKDVEEPAKRVPSASPAPAAPAAPSAAVIADAKREALRRHPDLSVPGSPMNVAFFERYHRYQKEHPEYFQDAAWPIRLADETANDLKGR